MAKSEAIRVRLEVDELEVLDEYCKKHRMSKSNAIRRAIRLLHISQDQL